MGAKPARQDLNMRNFSSSSASNNGATSGSSGVSNELQTSPSLVYNYNPYFSAPQAAYPNMMCLSMSPPQAQLQAPPYMQPQQMSIAKLQPTPAPTPYQTSQSIAFDHWQFNNRPNTAPAGMNTLGRMNNMNKPTMLRPTYEHIALKYPGQQVIQLPPQIAQISTPPPPPPPTNLAPQIHHHHLSHNGQIIPVTVSIHPSTQPQHQQHPPHIHNIPPPYLQQQTYIAAAYHSSNRINSSSTANSSKSSSSFSSMS